MVWKTDIGSTNGHPTEHPENYKDNLDVDVLIVGAGFGGIYLLRRLRDELGLNVKIYDAASELGGIWHWNCYPGARVDSDVPIYEYSNPEVYKDWTWTERFPDHHELCQYFAHVEKVVHVKKDVAFNSRVVSAQFVKDTQKWEIKTEDGRTAHARYFINAIGYAAKRHFPDWKGLESFQGVIHHSSFWPSEGVDTRGKKVAVIGTGSTGVQIAQETAKDAASVTVFQRTPNLCLPMRQRTLTKQEQDEAKKSYPDFFRHRLTTFAGFSIDFADKKTFDDNEEQREAFFQDLWDKGNFHFWLATYKDMLFDIKANDEAYNFWAKKTRARITDAAKRDMLAPLKPPHPFGTKRPSLEQDLYEQLNKPHNHVVDIKATPVVEVKENGILTSDGKLHEFDIIALATGFDAASGGMRDMGLKDQDGVPITEKWSKGVWSFLGITCNNYPNMFFLYGAQGPTAFSNGPTCVEVQGDWIFDAIAKCRKEGITYLDPTPEAEKEWKKKVNDLSDKTLFPLTKSWYMGANIDGKPLEQLNYAGGLPLYEKECREVLESFRGFLTSPA